MHYQTIVTISTLHMTFNILFIYLAVPGLLCGAQAFSSCSEPGLLFVVVHRLLIVVASLVEHDLLALGLQ